jgi:hypothetical protein
MKDHETADRTEYMRDLLEKAMEAGGDYDENYDYDLLTGRIRIEILKVVDEDESMDI